MTGRLHFLQIAVLGMLASCAGPHTPFGAFNALYPGAKLTPKLSATKLATKREDTPLTLLNFLPPRQVLHTATDFSIVVERPHRDVKVSHVRFYYDGNDVTKSLLHGASVIRRPGEIVFHLKNLRLEQKSDVEFLVRVFDAKGKLEREKRLEFPKCEFQGKVGMASLDPFTPHPDLVAFIEAESLKGGYNPSLIAALIAQESAFNPRAVSWAKALGLTQITPLADKAIQEQSPTWPRYAALPSLSYPLLKGLLAVGYLDSQKDYRLHPQYSVSGGILYLDYLMKYWTREDKQRLRETVLDDDSLSKVILASYNAGPSRVSKAIKSYGPKWLQSETLNSANEYVAKVTSFCDFFSNEGQRL